MLAFQERIQGGLPVDRPAMLWLVEHAGGLLTKYLVGRDGRTALERLMGKPSRGDGWEFGERVFYRVRPPDMDRSLNPRG
eukprot:10065859-Alexandrium_andersonii.AAC.1